MPQSETTMSDLLRRALFEANSIRAVAKATGLEHSSLVRFVNGETSLRLDLADRLAGYFGIESKQIKRKSSKGR